MNTPDVSVLIVTWNVRDLTLQCIEALYERRGGIELEIIVVDNGSSDGTTAALREQFPAVRVIENDYNAGFPRANNQALAVARGRHVLFLNSDTVVGEGTIQACVSELDAHPDIGMVGCRLMYPDGRVQYESGRNPYLLRDLLSEVFYLHMLFPHSGVFSHYLMGDWDHLDDRDVEAISGAFMMARRSVAEEVGGLPEELMMYHEDLSFCLRIRQRGHRIRYLGHVSTLHLTNQTTNKHKLRWYLLEGECKVRLIREAQGSAAATTARGVFAVRSGLRLILASIARVVPGMSSVRRRYPRVFDIERHALQLAWSVSPRLVRAFMPAASRPGQAARAA